MIMIAQTDGGSEACYVIANYNMRARNLSSYTWNFQKNILVTLTMS